MKKLGSLMMLLCCVIPMLLIVAASALGLMGDVSGWLPFVLMLGCPLMMLIGHSHSEGKIDDPEKRSGCH